MEQAHEKEIPRHRLVLGAYVNKARKERGMTQAELSEHLAKYGMHTHPTSIAKIEAGTRGVTVDELVAMGAALGWDSTMIESLLSPPSPLGASADEAAADLALAIQRAHTGLLWAIGLQEKGAAIVRQGQEDGVELMDDETFKAEGARATRPLDDSYRLTRLSKVVDPEFIEMLPRRARAAYEAGERYER